MSDGEKEPHWERQDLFQPVEVTLRVRPELKIYHANIAGSGHVEWSEPLT